MAQLLLSFGEFKQKVIIMLLFTKLFNSVIDETALSADELFYELSKLSDLTALAECVPALYFKYQPIFDSVATDFLFNKDKNSLPEGDPNLAIKTKARLNFQNLYKLPAGGARYDKNRNPNNIALIRFDEVAEETGFYGSAGVKFWAKILNGGSQQNNEAVIAKNVVNRSELASSSTALPPTASSVSLSELPNQPFDSTMLGLGLAGDAFAEDELPKDTSETRKAKLPIIPLTALIDANLISKLPDTENGDLFTTCILKARKPGLHDTTPSALDYLSAHLNLLKKSDALLLMAAHITIQHTGYYPMHLSELTNSLKLILHSYLITPSQPDQKRSYTILDSTITNLLSNHCFSEKVELKKTEIVKLCKRNPAAANHYIEAQLRFIKGPFKHRRRSNYLHKLLDDTKKDNNYSAGLYQVIRENSCLASYYFYKMEFNILGFSRQEDIVFKKINQSFRFIDPFQYSKYNSKLKLDNKNFYPNRHKTVNLAMQGKYSAAIAHLRNKQKNYGFGFKNKLFKLLCSTVITEDNKQIFSRDLCKVIFGYTEHARPEDAQKWSNLLVRKFRKNTYLFEVLWHTDKSIAQHFYVNVLDKNFRSYKQCERYFEALPADISQNLRQVTTNVVVIDKRSWWEKFLDVFDWLSAESLSEGAISSVPYADLVGTYTEVQVASNASSSSLLATDTEAIVRAAQEPMVNVEQFDSIRNKGKARRSVSVDSEQADDLADRELAELSQLSQNNPIIGYDQLGFFATSKDKKDGASATFANSSNRKKPVFSDVRYDRVS